MPPTHSASTYTMLRQGIDDAAFTATEHQLHLASTLGAHPKWRLHTNNGTAEFITRHGTIITATVHPPGIMDGTTWTWAWADSRIREDRSEAARQVRDFGRFHDNAMLARSTYPLTPQRTRITPEQLVAMSKNVHRIWRHFVFPLDDSTRLYAAIHLPTLELPDPSTASIRQTITTAHRLFPITRFRRAAVSYARLRGITHQENRDHTHIRLMPSNGTVELSWEDCPRLDGVGLECTPQWDTKQHDQQARRQSPQRPGRHRRLATHSAGSHDGADGRTDARQGSGSNPRQE